MNESWLDPLQLHYALQIRSLQKVPAGWSASAWRAATDRGDLFLKVYDKNKPTTRKWIARTAAYLPVQLYLAQNTPLGARMTAPILARDGSYCWEDADAFLLAFPFLPGESVCASRLTRAEIRALAELTAELHRHGAELPVPTAALRETFDVSFCDPLAEHLARLRMPSKLSAYISELQSLARTLSQTNRPLVLAHTDIHGWNLIRSNVLTLIDWEGLTLAPPEADLFSFTDTFFFGYARDELLAAYREARNGYTPDPVALRFYRLRRRLDDIAEFASSLLHDELSPETRERSRYYLNAELNALDRT